MADLSILLKYFPQLTTQQVFQFTQLFNLYKEWNEKINVISRKDVDQLYERHILHSLAIVKVISFKKDTTVIDIGTGGGFPGIPLAVFFPEVHFTLADSIGKKIKVVNEITAAIELKNTKAIHARVEELKGTYDFAVSRATAPLSDLMKWTQGKYKRNSNNDLDNGLICLKGGDLEKELKPYKKEAGVFNIKNWFSEDFFETKKVIYLPAR